MFRLRPIVAAVTVLIAAAGQDPAEAIGMRHDVPESEYLALAQNRAPYLAGLAPDFSSVCAIGIEAGATYELIGSGVLIAPQWVLTAAHVILGPPGSPHDFLPGVQVRFGASASRPTHARQVLDIAIPLPIQQLHPLLGQGEAFTDDEITHAEFHDLALLFLDRPVENSPPARCDDTPVDLVNYFICIAGFGDSTRGNLPFRRLWRSPQLKRAGENVIDRVVTFNPLTQSHLGGILIFDFDNGQEGRNSLNGDSSVWTPVFGPGFSHREPRDLEAAPYPGDSGGPAFALLDGEWRVVGVSSYGTGYPPGRKRSSIRYGDILVYTGVKPHAAWIHQVIHAASTDEDEASPDTGPGLQLGQQTAEPRRSS